MFRTKLLAVAALGFAAAACSYTSNTTTQASVPARPMTGSEQICVDYGFTPGTDAYSRCVSREAEWRARGRVAPGYAEDRLLADAREACFSYGLDRSSPAYDRCLRREMDARRSPGQASATTVYSVQPSLPPGPPPASYVETRSSPTVGTEAFRDEYGFRYDAYGNRLDARGNVISPHSTTPW